MPTFHLWNFGCRASQADGAALKQQLLAAGMEEVARPEESQVAVLNTCTVTATADAEVRQIVRRIHRLNPHCRILVTGCYAQRAPQEIALLEGVAWVVGNSHKHLIAQLLTQAPQSGIRSPASKPVGKVPARSGVRSPEPFDGASVPLVEVQTWNRAASALPAPDTQSPTPDSPIASPDSPQILVGSIAEEFHFAPVFPDDRTRPTLKIQDGCNARCAFCVIPAVRGRSRSLEPEKVVEQVRVLEADGYREIVLSGINLGSYGRDLGRRITFLGLLERLLRQTAISRLRISSIEPMDVSPALIRLVAHESRLAEHFHVPLQSGSDRLLRLMRRRYWAAQYAERIRAIREQIPDAALGADVMVGFPGETDADHAASARFIASLPFTYLHVFPFSARPGTPAAAMANQVNGRIAHERGQELRAIAAEKRRAFLAAQVARQLSAITLDETEGDARVALSSNYLKVALPGSPIPANRLLDIWIGRASGGMLYGVPQL
jgi:threonylcarbamoyladenosine tRNA methylthiotransferase MtaB